MGWECAFHGQHAKVKGQLGGVHFVLQFWHRFQGQNRLVGLYAKCLYLRNYLVSEHRFIGLNFGIMVVDCRLLHELLKHWCYWLQPQRHACITRQIVSEATVNINSDLSPYSYQVTPYLCNHRPLLHEWAQTQGTLVQVTAPQWGMREVEPQYRKLVTGDILWGSIPQLYFLSTLEAMWPLSHTPAAMLSPQTAIHTSPFSPRLLFSGIWSHR